MFKLIRCHGAATLCLFLTLAIGSIQAQITSTVSGRVLDQQGLGLPGVDIHIVGKDAGVDRHVESDSTGIYKLPGLLAGAYQLTAAKQGFVTKILNGLDITVNAALNLDISMSVAAVQSEVSVSAETALLETNTSSSGLTITPTQIQEMPLNGRNYLDLLQLVPGVAINRQADSGSDASVPILGERAGNAQFLVDGLPNSDAVSGGASAQFNQESILEFQVVTAGYKAEFGHGSGGIINVVSKSGTNDFHGGVSFFHRNYKLDASDIPGRDHAPFLLRWDPSGQLGGALLKDRIFFFVSAERILESRDLNFQVPPGTPDSLANFEAPFNQHSKIFDTRIRGKLDEQWGRHRFTEQINLTNSHTTDFLPLSASLNLPSTRNNIDTRHLMLGFSDVALIGNQGSPFVLDVFGQYRGEPYRLYASHPEAGAASTLDNLFDSYTSGSLFGNLGQVTFGPGHTPLLIDQKNMAFGANLAKQIGAHSFKTGIDFQRTVADGTESNNLFNQLFATISDFDKFGPIDSGLNLLTFTGGLTPQDNQIRLRNNYTGIFAQDDWKIRRNLTLNMGIRWDYDSTFANPKNISPRIGFAWSVTSKTVVRASWGLFYDHFRVGTARDVPGFGGANITKTRYLGYPRLFYGNPSQLSNNFANRRTGAPCLSNTLTDAQIQAQGVGCTLLGNAINFPIYGIDHLNNVVAPGHAPIPANVIVNTQNVQQLTGLTPQQYADAASVAIGQKAGFFSYDPNGHLSTSYIAGIGDRIPVTVDPNFSTPYTSGMQAGIQHEFAHEFIVQADYYHKDIFNILGIRNTNLALEARLPGHTGQLQPDTGGKLIQGYGPWYAGSYDAAILSVRKRFGRRVTMQASYTFTHATDDAQNPDLTTDQQSGSGLLFAANNNGPSDSFVGRVPTVTDSATGQTNANGGFTASNGNPIPKAGTFYNGPGLSSGPSDLSLKHTFLLHGIVELPKGFGFSSIFRAQSGFPYSAAFVSGPDVDGDGLYNGTDYVKGRNRFNAPAFVNMDIRVSKKFQIAEKFRANAYFEFFNLFNNANPAAVQSLPEQPVKFGAVTQVLPGREGQVGVRFEF